MLLTACLAMAAAGVLGAEPASPGGRNQALILRTATGDRPDDPGSMWRYFETWQSDVALLNGKLVNVDVYEGRRKDDKTGQWVLCEPKQVLGSPFPPDDWRKAEFDDRDWIRHPGPFSAAYRSLAMIGLRGRFQVTDPARAGDLTLVVKFQGGAAAYVNGQEVGRAFLPAGKLANDTLAQEYPPETFLTAKGAPLAEPDRTQGYCAAASGNVRMQWGWDDDALARFKQRGRTAEFKVPASLLRKGVNVLAIEIRRAPANPAMFLTQTLDMKNRNSLGRCWNRASLEEVALSAAAPAAGVVPNVARPAGVQVWTEDILAPIRSNRFGDPGEPMLPIRIRGMKNGAYAGQVVVGSGAPIANLKAIASDLTQGPATIPARAIQVLYAGADYDALTGTAPLEQPAAAVADRKAPVGAGVLRPVWIVVQVPRDAAAGVYRGTLTVSASGQQLAVVPVELKVVGSWVVPDPQAFTTVVGVHESADSVAMRYNVPLWSEEHWKHLDAVYRLLAQIGTKDIYLPLVAKTHLANEQSMVRWIPQPGGASTSGQPAYRYDFSILERYLDTAMKHLGKVPVVCLYLHDYGFRVPDASKSDSAGSRLVKPCVTMMDPATGKLGELVPPEWGTPESQAFWKPVIDGARDILAKRGVEKSMMFGMGANNWVKEECLADLKKLYPQVLWVNRTHFFTPSAGGGKNSQAFGLTSVVGGAVAVCYEPDLGIAHCGWKSALPIINFPRMENVAGAVFSAYPATYRLFGEGALLAGGMGWNNVAASHGTGHFGADFWPVLKDPKGVLSRNLTDRYVFWHSLSLGSVIPCILAAGPEGPAPTVRQQLMREALQEAEVRVFVQDALLDPARRARLGTELEARCRALCLERMWALRYYSQFAQPAIASDYSRVFNQRQWEDLSERLYVAAGDVAAVLGKGAAAGKANP